MANEAPTFRNGVLSIFQSAVEDMAHKAEDAVLTAGARPGLDNPLISAGVAAAADRAPGPADNLAGTLVASPALQACADLGLKYLEARATGDKAGAAAIMEKLKFSECDPGWAATLTDYAKYFGPGGGLRAIPYVRAGKVGDKVLDMKPDARVALIGDWGTGTDVAIKTLQCVKAQNPDVLIHLGDVYYSGTDQECQRVFLDVVNKVFDRARTNIPVYTLAGNHDMYSGGVGYYNLLKKLNPPKRRQPASFFCLRASDNAWQFCAMDTGYHDHDPFQVTEVLTRLEKDEEDWHAARIKEFSGATILLSHHQLFSAFSQIGKADAAGKLHATNPNLLESFQRFQTAAPGRLAAWFWGHEHNLCIFKPYAELKCGRCIGHGAIPVLEANKPYDLPPNLVDPPQLIDRTRLRKAGGVYANGYAIVSLAAAAATLTYFQGTDTAPSYTEQIPASAA